MKRILMLSTGGTIASEPGEDGLIPKVSGDALMRQLPGLAGICVAECRTILNLDSSNMQPEDWALMAREVFAGLEDGFDGVVITHGTDTMAYSAAALSLMLQSLGKPVIFTGSQLPIGVPDSDAPKNLTDAFVAATHGPAGVYLVFDGLLIDGRCATKLRSAGFDAFSSVNRLPVGRIEDGRLILDAPAQPQGEGKPSLDCRIDPEVMRFRLFPGFRPGLIAGAGTAGFHGVVIEGFGAGGVPQQRRSLLPDLETLAQSGVAVLLATQCLLDGSNPTIYEVGVRATRAGAIAAGTLSSEMAVVGLMFALGHSREPGQVAQRIEALDRSLREE